MEFDDNLFAPLFHGTWDPDAAADAFKHPVVAAWLMRMVSRKLNAAPVLLRSFDEDVLFREVVAFLWEKASETKGFRNGDGSAVHSRKAFLTTTALNCVRSLIRREASRERLIVRPVVHDDDASDTVASAPHPAPGTESRLGALQHLQQIVARVRSPDFGGGPARNTGFLIMAMPWEVQQLEVERACAARDGFARNAETTWNLLQKQLVPAGDSPLRDPELQRLVAWILRCDDVSVGDWDDWERTTPAAARRGLDLVQKWVRRVRDDLAQEVP